MVTRVGGFCVSIRLVHVHILNLIRFCVLVFGLGSATLCFSNDNWIKLQESKLALVTTFHIHVAFTLTRYDTSLDHSQRKPFLSCIHRYPSRHIAHLLLEVSHVTKRLQRVMSLGPSCEFLSSYYRTGNPTVWSTVSSCTRSIPERSSRAPSTLCFLCSY